MGSSSAVTVGLLHALFAYRGRQVTAEELAERACAIEIERCGKPIGKQDQYIAAFGGIRDIRFGPGEEVMAEEVGLATADRRALQHQIMLFYTGITRSADPILAEQNANVEATLPQLDLLRDLAGFAVERLQSGDVDAIGPAHPGELGGQAQARVGGLERPDRRGGQPGPRRRGLGSQADRRGRRRLPARHLPGGAAARRAREPRRHAGTSQSGSTVSAPASCSTCNATSGVDREMKLLWRGAWMEAPGLRGPGRRGPDRGVRDDPARRGGERLRAQQRRPGRKVAVFLLTDGPRNTLRKARTKRDEPRFTGDYRITVVLGRGIRVRAAAWWRWPRGCRPRRSSWWSTATWSGRSRTGSPTTTCAGSRPG